jgi:hypothetical protein
MEFGMQKVKALSVVQPWATLLMRGVKRFETRGWQTRHRGLLAIHASARIPYGERELCRTEPCRRLLRDAGYESWKQLPLGVILGTVELVRCVRVEDLEPDSCSSTDRQWASFHPGRWAWEVIQPRPWAVPLPVRGSLGVFEVTLPLFQESDT